MGNTLKTHPESSNIKIKVWHKFSHTIPHGWPEEGCLFFTVNKGITIREFLYQINKHRRPEYHIKHLYKRDGNRYNHADILYTNDLYI
jgi:hypothetical protein